MLQLPFATPIRAKLQTTNYQQLEWDDPLSTGLCSQWHKIAHNMREAATITLPRRFFRNSEVPPTAPYLHAFADASPKAYGAVSCIITDNQCLVLKKIMLHVPKSCVSKINFSVS